MAIGEKSEKVLRILREIGESEVADIIKAVTEFDARNTVNSLYSQRYIDVAKVLNRVLSGKRNKGTIAVRIYKISEKGIKILDKIDAPPKIKQPKIEAKKQELHPMQNFVIPERDPNVAVVYVEHEGRTVKVTYGARFKRDTYKTPPGPTRYKSNPIRGIHAL